MMPGLSGLEVLKLLRERHPATELPVIMATARDQSEEIVHALRLGANDYVTKPLDFPVVMARIETQLLLKRSVAETVRLKQDLAERNQALEESNARLSRINRRMEHDLRTAAQIQASLLPRSDPDLSHRAVRLALRAVRRVGRRQPERGGAGRSAGGALCARRQRARRGLGAVVGDAQPAALVASRPVVGAGPPRR